MRADDAHLLRRRLLVVTGKGGVGKSTVAVALALAAARRGLNALLVEVGGRHDAARLLERELPGEVYVERPLGERLARLSIDADGAMREYLRRQLPVRPLAQLLARSHAFGALTATAPGLRELLTIGKVWELARPGGSAYDVVVLDAPATGHGVALLEAPRTFAGVARGGPVLRQAGAIAGFLADPGATGLVAVCAPEELPVAETLALRAGARSRLHRDLACAVVNGLFPRRFSAADERVLRAAPPSPARRAALFQAAIARRQRAQLERLRRALDGVPVTTLPFVFDFAPATVERLSRELVP